MCNFLEFDGEVELVYITDEQRVFQKQDFQDSINSDQQNMKQQIEEFCLNKYKQYPSQRMEQLKRKWDIRNKLKIQNNEKKQVNQLTEGLFQENGIKQPDWENYQQEFNNSLIFFHRDNCTKQCNRMLNTFLKLKEVFEKERKKTQFFHVQCLKNEEYCQSFRIWGDPILKYAKDGLLYRYTSDYDFQSMKRFIVQSKYKQNEKQDAISIENILEPFLNDKKSRKINELQNENPEQLLSEQNKLEKEQQNQKNRKEEL